MMAGLSEITGPSCGATRQIWRCLRYPLFLAPLKEWLAFFDEGFGGFLVIVGVAGARVVDRLGVETGFQRQMLGVVDVALDVAQRHRRPLRQRHRQFMRRG